MASHSSAVTREGKSHTTTFDNTFNGTISNAIKRRARAVINDIWIDAETRAIIRYGLEINDPALPELVRRVDAGESIADTNDERRLDASDDSTVDITEDDSIEEKVEALVEIICREGNEPAIKSAALLVLMATLENAAHPKALANTAKHLVFTHCGELNVYGIVDDQIAIVEGELFSADL